MPLWASSARTSSDDPEAAAMATCQCGVNARFVNRIRAPRSAMGNPFLERCARRSR